MDEKTVQEIKEMLIKKLKEDFGYCGCVEGENAIMLNSGKDNIVINIKWE